MCCFDVCFYDQHLLVTADYKCGCLHREEIQVYFEFIELGAEAMAVQCYACYMLCLGTIAAHSTEAKASDTDR